MNNEPALIIDADDDEQFGFAVEAVEVGPRGLKGEQGIQGIQGEQGIGITGVSLTGEKGLDFELNDGSHLYTPSVQGERGERGLPGVGAIKKLDEAVGNGISNEMSVTFPNNGRDFTIVKLYLQPRVTTSINEIYLKVNDTQTNNYNFRITNLSSNSTNNSTVYRNQNKITLAYLPTWWISGELIEITVSILKEGGSSCRIHALANNFGGTPLDFKQTMTMGTYYNNQDTSPTTKITIGAGPSSAKWHEKARLTAYAILN